VTSPVRRRPDLVVILVFAAALSAFLPWIGTQEIWSKDEARTALVVKEMLSSGDWSLPRVPGGAYGRKPPLYHWLTALIVHDDLDEAELRLPAAVTGAGTVALTYLFGAQLASSAVGLVAAAILVASPSFFEWSRVGRMETLLVFCTTLSLWGLGRWLVFGGRGNSLLFGMGIGLAVITKGPAGLIPLAVAALMLVVARRHRPGRLRDLGLGLALAVAVPLAWLGPASLAAADFAQYVESLGPTVANELARPWSSAVHAVAGLAIGFFPWTLLLPGTFLVLTRAWPVASPLIVVCLGWVVVILVVFLVALSPRAVYFLSAHPALALLVAWSWLTAEGRQRRWLAIPLGLGIAAVIAFGIAAAIRPLVLRFHEDPLQVPALSGLAAGGVLLVAGALAFWCERRRSVATLASIAVGVVITLLVFDIEVRTPFYNGLYPIRATVKRLEEQIPPGAEVGYTEANRITALAVRLARPLRQLTPAAITQRPLSPAPRYVLLPDVEFQAAREPWSLERVDEVVLHRVRYVLAVVGSGAVRSPR
jgi:4-amino-4-deoxy-L-arabinose transferase-like glycosyltransferase